MTKEQMKFVVPEGFELKIIDEDILNPDLQWEGWYPEGSVVGEIHYGEWSVGISSCGDREVHKVEPDGDGWKGNRANSITDLARMGIESDEDLPEGDDDDEYEHIDNPWFDLGFLHKNGEKNEKYFMEAGNEWCLPDDLRGDFETPFHAAIECAVGLLKENKRLEEEAKND
jgi:hypothetical protein